LRFEIYIDMKRKIVVYLVFTMIVTGVFSQQAAKNFVFRQDDTLSQDIIYVVMTDNVFYANEALAKITNFDDLDSIAQTDLTKKYVLVGQRTNDSILVKTFKEELLQNLEYFGFRIIAVSSADSLPKTLNEREHTLNVAQLEVEEFITIDSIQCYDLQKPYIYHKALNGVRFNAWFLYDEKDTASDLTLFCNEETTDDFNGTITFNGSKPIVNYTHTPINPNDTYIVARATGRTAAIYFFNFLLNQYVFSKTAGEDKHYYGLDYNSGNLLMDSEPFDNFDVIDN
jgi:hypothetical protein